MMHPSTMKLVDRLCAMTAQGKIDWAHGETPESLVYDTEGYSVILHGDPTNIQLTDSSGTELEKVTAADLSQTPHAESGTYDAVVAKLLIDAQRHARGTETAISTVLQGLDLDGDGVVDMPMEDGLAPTAEEIADHAPDMAEDTADESGVATLADADVTDVSNAVASLADEVNQNETDRLTEAPSNGFAGTTHDPVETETHTDDSTPAAVAPIAGLGMAGLGAAGLLKSARKTAETGETEPANGSSLPPADTPEAVEIPSQPDIEPAAPEIATPEPVKAETPETPLAETGFNLSSTDASNTPLQLSPHETHTDNSPSEPDPTLPPESSPVESDTFVRPEPGQVLSLSGLTNGLSSDTPIMAGTATTLSHINPALQPAPEPVAGPAEPELEAEASEPVATPAVPEPAATPEIAESPAPEDKPLEAATPVSSPEVELDTQVEPDPEPVKETPRTSRFNPWI